MRVSFTGRALNTPNLRGYMQKKFEVKLPSQASTPPGDYVVVACPKCGKKTYGVVGQKGKQCPVCRRRFLMPDNANAPGFKTPEAACRYIQAEEAKRAGRRDFAPVTSGFRPATCAPVIARTSKVVTEALPLDAQFTTWARQYFSSLTRINPAGVPTIVVVAAATKAGFSGVDMLIQKAIAAGILARPKSYVIELANQAF